MKHRSMIGMSGGLNQASREGLLRFFQQSGLLVETTSEKHMIGMSGGLDQASREGLLRFLQQSGLLVETTSE